MWFQRGARDKRKVRETISEEERQKAKDEAKRAEVSCANCVHRGRFVGARCELNLPQVRASWKDTWLSRWGWLPAYEIPAGGCSSFDRGERPPYKPSGKGSAQHHVVRFDAEDRVLEVEPLRGDEGNFRLAWIIPRAPVPPVGAKVTFNKGKRRHSTQAVIRWVDEYGSSKHARRVEALFGTIERDGSFKAQYTDEDDDERHREGW